MREERRQRRQAVEKVLQNLTSVYNDGDDLPVRLDRRPGINYGGYLCVEEDGPDKLPVSDQGGVNELRLYVDQLSHGVEHYRETDMGAQKDLMDEFGDASLVAGVTYGFLEDAYVDKNRGDRFRGMRRTAAFRADVEMDSRPQMREVIEGYGQDAALIEAMYQVSIAGYAKGVSKLSSERRQFVALAEQTFHNARTETDYEVRIDMTSDLVGRFLGVCEDIDEATEYIIDGNLPPSDLPGMSDASLKFLQEELAREAEEQHREEERKRQNQDQDGAQSDQQGNPTPPDKFALEPDESKPGYDPAKWPMRLLGLLGLAGFAYVTYLVVTGAMSWWVLAGIVLLLLLLAWLLSRLLNNLAQAATEAFQQQMQQMEGEGQQGQQGQPGQPGQQGQQGQQGQPQDGDSQDGNSAQSSTSNKPGEGSQEREGDADSEGTPEPVSLDDIDEEALKEALDRMEERADSGESRDWFDLDDDVDYRTPEDDMVDLFEELQEMETADWGELEQERDRHLQSGSDSKAERIQSIIENRGLTEEIEEAFRELKTRDMEIEARRGKRLNTRAVTRYKSGDRSVRDFYYHQQRAETGDRAIGVAVDLSGSMDVEDTQVALASVAIATGIIGDDLIIRGFTSSGKYRGGASADFGVSLPLITGPDEDFEMEHLALVSSGGGTPTSAGVVATRRLLRRSNKPERVLIVITDGQPNDSIRNGIAPTDECLQEVRKTRKMGMKVIGIGVGGVDEQTMDYVFEDDYVTVDSTDIAQQLVDIYRKQMKVA